MLNDIIFVLIMIFILLLFIAFISGLICSGSISARCSLRYDKPYLCQAIVDFPVPPEFRKLKWWPGKYWHCYLRQQDGKRLGLFNALPVQGGLLIREYALINYVKPKILFFVPCHALSAPKNLKIPWYFWAVRAYPLNIKGSPITLLITKSGFLSADPEAFAQTIYGRLTWIEK